MGGATEFEMNGQVRNKILQRLPEHDAQLMLSQMERVSPPLWEVVAHPGIAPKWVHFPESGVLSSMVVLEDGSTVLGAMHPLPFLNEGFVTNLEDFLLFCYTDGLTETINEKGEEFGSDALLKYFGEGQGYLKDLKTIHQDIIVALDEFKGRNGYHDDITILSCRVG